MLQIGFGYSPLRSGLTTFVAAMGAMAMKATASPILDRLGFRTVLVVNGLVGASFIAINGLLSPATPVALVLGLLLVGGYFRSLQFTGINAIAYADIAQERMSRAVSFASVAQQLALSVGVALGAGVVQIAQAGRHGPLTLGDFHWAFAAVALVSASSVLVFWRLPSDAGASLSSRMPREATRGAAARGVAEARPGSALG
jgi:MFS family permease